MSTHFEFDISLKYESLVMSANLKLLNIQYSFVRLSSFNIQLYQKLIVFRVPEANTKCRHQCTLIMNKNYKLPT